MPRNSSNERHKLTAPPNQGGAFNSNSYLDMEGGIAPLANVRNEKPSLAWCRTIDPALNEMPDEELAKARDTLMAVAQLAFESWQEKHNPK